MSNNSSPAAGRDFLVIGYGNTLRGDDGVGPRVAEAVGKLNLPGVRTLICQQLSPEHAELISQARAVVTTRRKSVESDGGAGDGNRTHV